MACRQCGKLSLVHAPALVATILSGLLELHASDRKSSHRVHIAACTAQLGAGPCSGSGVQVTCQSPFSARKWGRTGARSRTPRSSAPEPWTNLPELPQWCTAPGSLLRLQIPTSF